MAQRVALIVDNPTRDLPGLVLVAHALCQAGITCFLVPFNLASQELWSLAPDFVLLNYLRRTNEAFARNIVRAGIGLGFLETEGGVTSLQVFRDTGAQDAELRAQVACFCSWGPELARQVCEAGLFAPEQVFVTGAPRYDFYAQPWDQAARALSDYVEPYADNLVLVNGVFTLPNPRFKTPEQEVDMYVQRFGLDREAVVASQNNQERAMVQLTETVNWLAEALPEATFVYRPHPFERVETYETLLARRHNIHLVQQGPVDGWLLRTRALMHFNCSTAIEAGLLGVPSLMAEWIAPEIASPTVASVSDVCHSREQLATALEQILDGTYVPPIRVHQRLSDLVAAWFHHIDGEAHGRVANCIIECLNRLQVQPRRDVCRTLAYESASSGISWRARAGRTARSLAGLPVHFSFRPWQSEANTLPWDTSGKYFDADVVRRIVTAVHQTGTSTHGVRVETATTRGDYHFGYRRGRSVTVSPM